MNPLREDILGQPESLAGVIEYQRGAGRDALARLAAEVRHARQVIFTGMGGSLFAAAPAVAMMNSHGRACAAIEASELLYFGAAAIHKSALVVLISRSGETIEVRKLLTLVRSRGIRNAAVTNTPASSIEAQAHLSVRLNSVSDRLVAFQTYTATATVLLMLAAEVSGESIREIETLPDLLRTEVSREPALLEGAQAIYLLGRGASLGSAQEGALLFHEAARIPAIALSPAQFRHGFVEALSPEIPVFVFATQPETSGIDEQITLDMRERGAKVRVIGPEIAARGPIAAVLEIVPVQLAAVALAASRGIPTAEFRYATMVTSEESGLAG